MVDITSILHLVPPYLHDIEDYLKLTSADRATRSIISENSTPHTLLLLCHQSRRTFFRPDPLFLLSALARPLSIWARQSTENLRRLVHSFWSGEEAVLDLAVSVPAVAIEAKWSLAKVRELWEWRMRVVNPLSDLIDKCVGNQWYDVPDFWDGGREDAATLYAEPNETVFRMILYGELFGDGWDHWIGSLDPSTHVNDAIPPFASLPTRLEFVKYLLPDWHTPPIATESTSGIHRGLDVTCSRPYRPGEIPTPPQTLIHPETRHTRTIHPFRAVQKTVGPYSLSDQHSEFQSVLLHLFKASPLWRQVTSRLRELCGGDFPAPVGALWAPGMVWWKQSLWENALYLLGHKGMEMVIQVWQQMKSDPRAEIQRTGEGWEKMKRSRAVLAAMQQEPTKVQIGARWTYEVPHFVHDMEVTVWDR